MAWVVVGAAVIGAGATLYAANQAETASRHAANAQKQAMDNQAQVSREQLAFQKQQYEDWQEIYGPIQENLSSFYQQLTPETFAAAGLQHAEQQYQAIEQEFQRSFAQRGITTGAQALMEQQAALATAENKAQIRQQAPLQVATAQQGFLDHQVSNPATAGMANAYNNQAAMYGQQAGVYGNQAAIANQQQAQAIGTFGNVVGQGFKAYGQYQQAQQFQQQQIANQYGTNPGSQQSQMLAAQNQGFYD